MLTPTNGPCARLEAACIAWANSSLPVPVSPNSSTGLLESAARRAWRPSSLTPSEAAPSRLIEALLTCAALTFLNPHVYLDTVVLLGALANEHHDGRWLFGVGAVAASAVWFTSLGFGARRLSGSVGH